MRMRPPSQGTKRMKNIARLLPPGKHKQDCCHQENKARLLQPSRKGESHWTPRHWISGSVHWHVCTDLEVQIRHLVTSERWSTSIETGTVSSDKECKTASKLNLATRERSVLCRCGECCVIQHQRHAGLGWATQIKHADRGYALNIMSQQPIIRGPLSRMEHLRIGVMINTIIKWCFK